MHILKEVKSGIKVQLDDSILKWLEQGDVRTENDITYYSSHGTEYEYISENKVNYKQKPSSWRNRSPIEMANRIVACDIIKNIGPEKLQKVPDESLKEVFLLPVVDENGKDSFEIDWEFVLFECTEYQIGKLLDCFVPVKKGGKEPKKVELPKSSGLKIVGKDGKPIQ